LSGGGRPFHPFVSSSVPSSIHPIYPNLHVFSGACLLASLVGGEELGPLRAMTATGVGKFSK
jgi:hypothetical protein